MTKTRERINFKLSKTYNYWIPESMLHLCSNQELLKYYKGIYDDHLNVSKAIIRVRNQK